MLVIVCADDFGLCHERDAGILRSFLEGCVNVASLLVNGPTAAEAVSAALHVGLPLGLHLNLTEGVPVAPMDQVASLLDPARPAELDTLAAPGVLRGKAGFHACFAADTSAECATEDAASASAVDVQHVRVEIRAQWARFCSLVGAPPRHVDGHQHVHVLPGLAALFCDEIARLADEAGRGSLRVRVPDEPPGELPDDDEHRFRRLVASHAAAHLRPRIGGVLCATDRFIGLALMGRHLSAERLRAAVARARAGGAVSVEVMVHPGYSGAGWDDFNTSPEREHELAVCLALGRAGLDDAPGER